MTMKANTALISVGWFLTGLAVMLSISRGVMAVFIAPVLAALYRLQLYYRRSAVGPSPVCACPARPPPHHLPHPAVTVLATGGS